MDTTLIAELRTEGFGKGFARKIRATGKAPAVIYSKGGEATHVTLDPTALLTVFRKSQNRNTVINLSIDGVVTPTLVLEAQRHPVSREVLHVDFYKVGDDLIEVEIPLNPVGTPMGTISGGRLRVVRRTVKAKCHYTKIPTGFDVDVSELDIGDQIMISQISTPEGVSVHYKQDFIVMYLYGRRVVEA